MNSGADIGEKFEGVVERISYFNDETHFCIAKLRITSGRAAKKLVTIKGIMPNLQCGENISLSGDWAEHHVYGAQVSVKNYETRLPSSLYGIEKFLGSGLVRGIGETYAKRIVEKFGEKTLAVIDSESARLKEVKGIGAVRIKKIRSSWEEQKALREVVIFLRTYGVGMGTCVRIMKKYGGDSSRIVREEPYRIVREIDGIGFKTGDKIALNIGIPNESFERVEAGIMHVVSESELEGNTCVRDRELIAKTSEVLGVETHLVAAGVERLLAKSAIKRVGKGLLQSAPQDYAEMRIAKNLLRIAEGESRLPPIKLGSAIEWAKARAGFAFAPEQEGAILSALQSKICVVTGGPGTGKTTILRALCDILSAKKCVPVLSAPTGRAAQRMGESARIQARTIHRMLRFGGGESGKFFFGEENMLEGNFFIVDEASMLDTKLAASLFSAIPSHAHLLLLGDVNQLPSVGAGNVLKNIISSQKFSVARLEKIFRQEEQSKIVLAAHNMLSGGTSLDMFVPKKTEALNPEDDFHFVDAPTPEECVSACVELVKNKIPRWYGFDSFSEVQVLAPMHRGRAGISSFNAELRNALNKDGEPLACGFEFFKIGDKIMQTRNNYDLDLYNGDMGRIVDFLPDAEGALAEFDGREVRLVKSDLVDVQPAYAISIHKSQGSEFPAVVIPILKQHFMMLQRNLLYTAITRGKKKVFVVGDRAAWEMGVKNSLAAARISSLKDRLQNII